VSDAEGGVHVPVLAARALRRTLAVLVVAMLACEREHAARALKLAEPDVVELPEREQSEPWPESAIVVTLGRRELRVEGLDAPVLVRPTPSASTFAARDKFRGVDEDTDLPLLRFAVDDLAGDADRCDVVVGADRAVPFRMLWDVAWSAHRCIVWIAVRGDRRSFRLGDNRSGGSAPLDVRLVGDAVVIGDPEEAPARLRVRLGEGPNLVARIAAAREAIAARWDEEAKATGGRRYVSLVVGDDVPLDVLVALDSVFTEPLFPGEPRRGIALARDVRVRPALEGPTDLLPEMSDDLAERLLKARR
jgi:hypothetical protein